MVASVAQLKGISAVKEVNRAVFFNDCFKLLDSLCFRVRSVKKMASKRRLEGLRLCYRVRAGCIPSDGFPNTIPIYFQLLLRSVFMFSNLFMLLLMSISFSDVSPQIMLRRIRLLTWSPPQVSVVRIQMNQVDVSEVRRTVMCCS